MLTRLRLQVQSILYAVPAQRRPALRRSDAPDALFATDLPMTAEKSAVDAFLADMGRMGWRCGEREGWIALDAPVPEPETRIPAVPAGECGCCIALLQRHPDDAAAEDFIRAVVKAADAGRIPFERLCRKLHGELAARLRRHELLPGELLPYLCQAYLDIYK